MSGKPRWKVLESNEDTIPGRLSVHVEFDDGEKYWCHVSQDRTPEQVEQEIEKGWLKLSKSDKAKAEREKQGKVKRSKSEHFPKGRKSKD